MPSQGIELLFPDYVQLDTAYQAPLLPSDLPAGTSLFHKIGPDAFEVLVSLTFALVTSAAVATRYMRLFMQTADGFTVAEVPAVTTQAASGVLSYFYLIQGTTSYQAGSSGNYVHPLWWLVMPTGYRFVAQADNMQAGDQIVSIAAAIQYFPTGTRSAISVGGPELLPVSADQVFAVQAGSPDLAPALAPAPVLSSGVQLEPAVTAAPAPAPAPAAPAQPLSQPLAPAIVPITSIPQPPPGSPAPTPGRISVPITTIPEPAPSGGGGLFQKST